METCGSPPHFPVVIPFKTNNILKAAWFITDALKIDTTKEARMIPAQRAKYSYMRKLHYQIKK